MQTEKEYYQDRSILRLHSESVGDYPLPDYNGDVKKVLFVKPEVVPSGKFLGDDSVEYSGIVNYNVVYLDSENNVTHTEFSTDYDIAVRVSGESYVDSDIETAVSSFNVRLVGPRKFSAKCSLESNVHVTERASYAPEGDAFCEYEPETATSTLAVRSSCFATGEERELAEEVFSAEGVIADEIEVLLCLADAEVKSSAVSDASVELRGEVAVSLLYKNADDETVTANTRLPFAITVDCEGIGECLDVIPGVRILSAKASVNPTDDGVSVTASVIVEPHVRGVKNSSLEVITDSYLKERGSENEYRDLAYTEHICTETREDRLDANVPLSDLTGENVSDFIYSGATWHAEGCEILDDKVKILGEVRFSAIACEVNEDGAKNYFNVKTSVPFEQFVNMSCQIHDNTRVFCHSDVTEAKMEIDSGRVSMSALVSSRVSLYSERKQRCLGASYLTDEEYVTDAGVVTVYYPDPAESIFGVAKKFHTSVARIAEDNALAESVFASPHSSLSAHGLKKLIIK